MPIEEGKNVWLLVHLACMVADATGVNLAIRESLLGVRRVVALRFELSGSDVPRTTLFAFFALALGAATPAHADDKNDEYRFTVSSTYALTEDRRWLGVGDLEYRWNQDGTYDVDYIGLGTIWNFTPKMEAWFMLIGTYTDNDSAPDVEELRPTIRFRNYFIKTKALRFYNMARLEYRIQHRDQGAEDTEYFRLRDRLGVEVSLGPKGQESRLHGIADIEPFYRFDRGTLDPLRLRVGLGWLMHDLVHAEFTYSMSLTREDAGDSLEWTDNIWQLNFKVARQKGLLQHLLVEEGGL